MAKKSNFARFCLMIAGLSLLFLSLLFVLMINSIKNDKIDEFNKLTDNNPENLSPLGEAFIEGFVKNCKIFMVLCIIPATIGVFLFRAGING